jgi:tetratricopeptide (TPR) repeat protein
MTTEMRTLPGRHGFRRPRAVGILAAAAVIVLATYASGALRAAPPRTLPAGPAAQAPAAIVPAGGGADPATLVAPGSTNGLVPGSIAQIDHAIAIWSANVAKEPRDFFSATTLASLYHERGRLSGDLEDQQKALEAAATAERAAPKETPARVIEAAIKFTLHDFDGAYGVAQAVVRDEPANQTALATMADSELELGRIVAARTDYDRLAAMPGAKGAALDIRLARLAYLSGDAAGAVRQSTAALAATRKTAAEGETVDLGFYEYAAAEYARLTGDVAAARTGYEAALAIRPTDLGALVGLGRVEAYGGDIPGAIATLEKAAEIAPQPETLGLLGDLETMSGQTADASRQFQTVRFIEQLGAIQATVFDRILIRFDLDHGAATDATLAKARASLEIQPDAAGHDTVAWTLYRLGRTAEAATEIAAAGGTNSADARIVFHAGAIALAQGDTAAGRKALDHALKLGAALDPIERAAAQTLLAR